MNALKSLVGVALVSCLVPAAPASASVLARMRAKGGQALASLSGPRRSAAPRLVMKLDNRVREARGYATTGDLRRVKAAMSALTSFLEALGPGDPAALAAIRDLKQIDPATIKTKGWQKSGRATPRTVARRVAAVDTEAFHRDLENAVRIVSGERYSVIPRFTVRETTFSRLNWTFKKSFEGYRFFGQNL